jgi:hypothetical protein
MSATDYSGWVGLPGGNTADPVAGTGTAVPVAVNRGDAIPTTLLPPQTSATGNIPKQGDQFNPAGWTAAGGGAGGNTYQNADGDWIYVDAQGKVISFSAAGTWDPSANGVLSGGEIRQGAHDLAGGLPSDPAGTPGINGSDNPIDAFNGAKAAADANGVTVNPDGTISGAGGSGGGGLTGTPQYQSLVDFSKQLQSTRDNYGAGATAVQPLMTTAPNAGPAASMTAAQSTGAPKIDPRQLGVGAQTVTPQTIAGVAPISAATAMTSGAGAQQIARPGAITPQQVSAQQIGPVGLAPGANAHQASQDAAQSMLQGAAEGTAPSAAEALLRKGIDENAGTALGMAATLQGSRPGMALHQGLAAAKGAIAKSAADAAALRANEMATGRQQYSDATTQARAQDIQAASTNLSAQIDTLKSNQQAALAAGNTNAANALQAQIQTVQSQLDASKANQQAALQATLANQSTGADLAKANASNQLQAQIVTMQQQLDVAKQNAANALAAGQMNQASALQAQIATMSSQLDAMKSNQASALSTATTNAGLTQQANLTNANLAQNQSQFGATQDLTAQQANQTAQTQANAINAQQYLGLTQLQGQANMAPYQAMVQQQAAQQAQQSMYLQMLATLASDATLKTDIADGADAALDFLDALPDAKTYRYLDEKKYYPGTQLGVVAQDLPASSVTTGPDGKKWISANVIGQILAGLGTVHKRVSEIEQRRETTRLTRGASRDSVPTSDIAEFARKLAS